MSRRMFDLLAALGRKYPEMIASRQNMEAHITRMLQDCPHWTSRDVDMMFKEMKFASRWIASGQIVYDLSHSLAAMFAITSSPPIEWQQSPHEAFVIKVPRRFLPVAGTIEPEYSYIYVMKENTLLVADHDTTAIMVVEYGEYVPRDILELSDPVALGKVVKDFALQLSDEERLIPAMMEHTQKTKPELADHEHRALATEALRSRRENLLRMASDATRLTPEKIGQKILLNRFVSNVIAYVTEHRPSSHPSTKFAALPHYEVLQPPPEVIIDRAFRDAAGAVVTSVLEGSVVGIRRALAHHVRGHWRDQACGAGRSQRKRIWIMPHRRGDESLGSVVRRVEQINIPASLN